MANKQGDFIWYELITTDVAAAAGFYASVIGWTAAPNPMGVEGYELFTTRDGAQVGGLMSNAKCPDMRPSWLGYVAVEDVDAKAEQLVAVGGKVLMPAMDVPGVGRFALVADPQGAAIYIMRGAVDGTSDAFNQAKQGHGNWNELSTSDQAGAFAFYEKAFGWKKGDSMPMGPMGEYQFIMHGEQMIGGAMKRQDGAPPPAWTFYFGVDDIDASTQAVTAGGGKILHGPAEVPGGAMVIVASDPQGATFGAVGPKKT
jgi:predicted enzyme related to lactoylglutathione lyase